MMHILERFFPKPYERETVARLRDETLHLGTRVLLLEDIVQHRKPVREIRRDAGAYLTAKAAKTAQLAAELGRAGR